ncbi:hypothetical protein ACHAXS_006339, partial [Conticribra weissflogii]
AKDEDKRGDDEELFGINEDEVGAGATDGNVVPSGGDIPGINDGKDIDNSLFDIKDVNDNEYDEGGFNMTNIDSVYAGQNNTDMSINQLLESNPPPAPLPPGWFLKMSHSYPGKFYYFNQDTGECSWELFVGEEQESTEISAESLNATAAAAAAAVKSILKRSSVTSSVTNNATEDKNTAESSDQKHKHGHHKSHSSVTSPSSRKKIKIATDDSNDRSERGDKSERSSRDKERSREKDRGSGNEPKEVRVLHILKKHRGSRRPASWRNPKITDSKEKAIADLRELISILQESKGDAKELRATFEELAKTESDCSSAKRGGDLGFFGRSKF